MIKIRHIILKDDLFNWINREDISKIELKNHRNIKLMNPKICEIYAYYKVNEGSISTILGACKKAIHDNEINPYLQPKDKAFLTGIESQKYYNFLRSISIKRLISIENEYDINLSIDKEIIKLIEDNKNERTISII